MRKAKGGATRKKDKLIKLELNDYGDYVVVSPSDDALFERFTAGSKQVADMADSVSRELEIINRKCEGNADFDAVCEELEKAAKIRIQNSKGTIKIIDGIFGEGTVRKYFRKFYEQDSNFLPSVEYFTDFFDQITPAMKQLQSMR